MVYRVLREQARSLPEYRFGQHLGPQAGLFVGTDYVIPGFYTQRGYQQYFVVQGASLANDILRDNWVLGEGSGISDMDLRRLMVELEQLYFRDIRELLERGGPDAWACCRSTMPARAPTRFPGCSPPTRRSSSCCWRSVAPFPGPWRRAPRRWQRPATRPAEKGGKLGKAAPWRASKARDALAKNPDTAKKSLQRRFEPRIACSTITTARRPTSPAVAGAQRGCSCNSPDWRAPASGTRRLSTWRRAAWAASAIP